MSDARAEAVEAMRQVLLTRGITAEAALDALTKPRTDECKECEGGGRVRGPADDTIEQRTGWEHSRTYQCRACSGFGTVTRGPIAVLVATVDDTLNEIEGWYPTSVFLPPPWDGERLRDGWRKRDERTAGLP